MIQTIIKAVQQTTGITFEQYTAPGKKREMYFARLIFSHNCFTIEKMDYRQIAKIVNRNPSTVFKYPGFFSTEVNVNSAFRKLVEMTKKNLNDGVSQ